MKSAVAAFSLCCMLASPAGAAVYRWLDADGVVHYSDQPVAGAKAIKLPESSHYTPPTYGAADAAGDQPQSSASSPAAVYASFSIAHPADGETLRNATGDVEVVMALDPDLKQGHQIQLVLDGLGARQTADSIKVLMKGVARGAHTLQAEVLDEKGSTLIRAAPVRFYLFVEAKDEPTVGTPPEDNEQALKPDYPDIPGDREVFPAEPGGDKPPAYAPAYPGIAPDDKTFTPTPEGKPPSFAPDYPAVPNHSGGAFSPAKPGGKSVYAPTYRQSN